MLEIPEHYRRQFADNWEHSVQQEVQRLGNRVKVESWTGKSKVYQTLDQLEWTERTGRLTGSTPQEVTAGAREMVKRDFKCQVIFDRVDKDFLGDLGLPDSEVQEEMKFAWNRAVDARIGLACDQTEYGGEEAYVTPIALPAGQQVGVQFGTSGPANIGMTSKKLREVVRIFESNDIFLDEREVILVMGPDEKQDLIAEVESSTNDVWAHMIAMWLEGKEKKLLGMTPVISNRIQHDAGTDVATCFAYEKNRGIYVCPDKMAVKFDQRADLDHAWQISAYAEYAFMRRHEEAVVTVACDRSPS